LLAELSSTEVVCAVLKMQLSSSRAIGRYFPTMKLLLGLLSYTHASLAMVPAVQLLRQQDNAHAAHAGVV
jgi:hypothetical protein